MSRTRRRKRWGLPGRDRDGVIQPASQVPPDDFVVEVIRRERRERDAEVDRLARGVTDPDDVPTKPMRRRLWELWRRW